MKYSILFCLVFILINSKVEINHYKSFLKLTKDLLYDDDDSDDSFKICNKGKDRDICIKNNLPDSFLECCFLSAEFQNHGEDPQSESLCQALPKKIGEIENIVKLKQTKELIKEVYGFILVNIVNKEDDEKGEQKMPDDFSANLGIKCQDTNFNVDFSFNLTDDDRAKLSSENHCFFKIFNSTEDELPPYIDNTVKCENYLMRNDSLNAGLECGYIKVDAKLNENTQSMKSCFPFNYKLLKEITNLNLIKKLKEQYLTPMGLDSFNVHVEFYNSKGDKVTYDTNKSLIISINLLLLLFILFMF